jgi:hypothetical protein
VTGAFYPEKILFELARNDMISCRITGKDTKLFSSPNPLSVSGAKLNPSSQIKMWGFSQGSNIWEAKLNINHQLAPISGMSTMTHLLTVCVLTMQKNKFTFTPLPKKKPNEVHTQYKSSILH